MTKDTRVSSFTAEVIANREAFASMLPSLIDDNLEGQYALMHNKEIEAILKDFHDAVIMGNRIFKEQPFSVEPITKEPVNLGLYSYIS